MKNEFKKISLFNIRDIYPQNAGITIRILKRGYHIDSIDENERISEFKRYLNDNYGGIMKTTEIKFRCTEKQKEIAKLQAEEKGCSLSEHILDLIKEYEFRKEKSNGQ